MIALGVLAACAPPQDLPEPVPDTIPSAEAVEAAGAPVRGMPEVRVEQVAGGEAIHAVPVPAEELAALERGERVTLTASDTDLRSLLAALAEAAGVNLVVSPEVEGRVTVHLEDVPAREALDTVIRQSGHMVTEPLRMPWGPVVFYVVPVNVNDADVATIQARFGVSEELARFLVRSRLPRE